MSNLTTNSGNEEGVMRIKATIFIIASYLALLWIYQVFQGSFEGAVSVSQLTDSSVAYSLANAVSGGFVPKAITLATFLVMCLIWIPTLKKEKK
jgi:hypothetical protein